MHNFFIYLLIAISLFALYKYFKHNWKRLFCKKDIQFPDPKLKRPDLLYGYYSCKEEQVAETKDHINIFMDSQFSGQDKLIQNILDAQLPTILDLAPQLFTRNVNGLHTVRPNAEELLDNLFILMSNKGALKYVKYLYPIDEPNNTVGNSTELHKALDLVIKVASKHSELHDVKYAVIYASDKSFICSERYDYIGLDDYDMKSNVLVGKEYTKIKDSLLVNQKTILVPGGAYMQDPTPFVNYAQNNEEVGMILPFLWFNDDTNSVKSLGIRSNGMKEAYTLAGKSII